MGNSRGLRLIVFISLIFLLCILIWPTNDKSRSITGFAVYNDTGELIQNVSGCAVLNTTYAVYNINSSLSLESGSTCIFLNASHIVINGNNYSITRLHNTGNYGLYASNKTNLTINDLELYNFTNGVYFNKVSNSTLNNLLIYNTSSRGIYFYSECHDNNILNTEVDNATYGVYIFNSSRNILNNLNISNCAEQVGLYVTYFSSYNNITNINSRNDYNGIYFEDYSDNNFLEFYNSTNDFSTIVIDNASRNIINNLTSINAGISITMYYNSYSNSVSNFEISNHSYAGLYFFIAPRNNFSNFTISNSNSAYIAIYSDLYTLSNPSENESSMVFENYNFNSINLSYFDDVIFRNTRYGEVILSGSRVGTVYNFSSSLSISNNSVNLSEEYQVLNGTANITLYGIGNRGFSSPAILRNDILCTDCTNFTSLIADTVIFQINTSGDYRIDSTPSSTVSTRSGGGSHRYINNTNIANPIPTPISNVSNLSIENSDISSENQSLSNNKNDIGPSRERKIIVVKMSQIIFLLILISLVILLTLYLMFKRRSEEKYI